MWTKHCCCVRYLVWWADYARWWADYNKCSASAMPSVFLGY